MKHILYTLFLSIIFLTTKAQTASVLLSTQSTAKDTSVRNVVFIGSGSRIWVAKVDSLKMYPYNMDWLNDSIISVGDSKYAQLGVPYSNPNFVNTLSAAKVFGLANVATTADYNDLTNKPNLSLYYLASNPNGYITDITSGDVITALGFTPYDSNNPNNYITSSSLSTKQNYADTSTWDVTMTTLEQQRYLKNLDTFNLSNFANDVGYITGITYNDVVGALGVVPIVQEIDGDTLNEIQTLTKSGTNITLSRGGTVSINDNDSSNTNELQTIGIVNRIITLSNAGGTVTIPYQSYDSLTNKPTIPTNTNQLTNGANFITRTGISLTTTGSGAATYNSGTGVINIPTSKRQETYAGTTDASGNYTITFPSAYAVVPNVQASITNQSNSQQFIMVTSATTTGCTIKVVQRNASFLSLLGLDVLTTGVTNVNGASVAVLVTER